MQITRCFTREGQDPFTGVASAELTIATLNHYIESALMLSLLAALCLLVLRITTGVLSLIAFTRALNKLQPGDELVFESRSKPLIFQAKVKTRVTLAGQPQAASKRQSQTARNRAEKAIEACRQ